MLDFNRKVKTHAISSSASWVQGPGVSGIRAGKAGRAEGWQWFTIK